MRFTQRNLLVVLVLIAGMVVGFIFSIQPVTDAKSTSCSKTGQLYEVVIENNHASPENTDAHLCDKLKFINRDSAVHEIAFGPHVKHVPYDNVEAKILDHNQSFTITLNSVGLYHFHDHFHNEVSGFFNVSM